MYAVSSQAKENYKVSCPTSWKKCKSIEFILEQKIRNKVMCGKSVPHNYGKGYEVIRYYFLNFLIDLQRNEVIQVCEVMNQPPVYTRKKIRHKRFTKKLIQKFVDIITAIKSVFLFIISETKYTANFDGSYKQGKMGIGFRITSSDGYFTILEHSEAIICSRHKFMDNSDAELIALIKLLEKVKYLKIRRINISGDCQGLIDVINFNYRTKSRLQGYVYTINSFLRTGGIKINYVERKYNHAHKLSRLSIIK